MESLSLRKNLQNQAENWLKDPKSIPNSLKNLLSKKGYGPISTDIKKYTNFYLAEDYHQDYYKKRGIDGCAI